MLKLDKSTYKLLIGIIGFCSVLIFSGYSYKMNSSCSGDIWSCLEFKLIFLGIGIFLFSLPLIGILLFWEVFKKYKQKKEKEKNIDYNLKMKS